MKSKNFTSEIWKVIEDATLSVLRDSLKTGLRPVAAFDADGTLWDTDLGESFFKYQIAQCSLSPLQNLPKDPWTYYREWKNSGDPRPAYLWLAQINEGLPIAKVRAWASDCVQKGSPLPIFDAQRTLIQYFLKNEIDVFVVTASVKWSVEPGAQILGIPEDHVLGVSTQIENQIISAKQAGTITYREGKAQALLERTEGRRPFFCCGNTTGDLNLLKAATHAALAVQSCTDPSSELYKTEADLQAEARSQGWLQFQF